MKTTADLRRDFQIRLFAVFKPLLTGKGSLLEYVKDKNLNRRQLTQGQKAMVAAKMANLAKGGDRRSEKFKGSTDTLKISQEKAAQMLSVGEATVKRASAVLRSENPELIQEVETGKIQVRAAADIAKLPKSEQPTALEMGGDPLL